MQQKIQHIQDIYGELLKKLPHLEQSLQQWKQVQTLRQELEAFYFNPQWIELHDNADQFNIDTKGNYSVLSEDAIWNLLVEQREIAEELNVVLGNLLKTEENE